MTAPQGRLLSLPLLTRCAHFLSHPSELDAQRRRVMRVHVHRETSDDLTLLVVVLDVEANESGSARHPPADRLHRRSSVLENDGAGSRPNP